MSNFFTQQHVILASASSSRRQLLHSLGVHFEIIPSHCDEEKIKKEFPLAASFAEMASLLACAKALDVSQRYPNSFVLAADQVCAIGETYLDKPLTHSTAFKHLQLLSGKTHEQIAAMSIAKAGQILWKQHDIAHLTMRALTNETIETYLQKEKPYQSCGAYHYEGVAKWLFKDVRGNDSTILGLPLVPLAQALIDLNIVLFA